MDLEKAYNKIDNLCCLNSTVMQTIKSCIEQNLNVDPKEIDFFKAYKETNGDEDFCKDANEMIDALEIIKQLVDLQKQLGCPLEVLTRALKEGVYTEYAKFLFGRCKIRKLEVYLDYAWNGQYRLTPKHKADFDLDLSEYKKTWWLKKNKEE